MSKSKIKDIDELLPILDNLRKEGGKIVFTNGCFDIIHVGHVRYLSMAKSLGDILVVGINTDESVKRIKGKNRPVNPQEDRAEVLAALESVDYVAFFSEDLPSEIIRKVRPHIHVKGGDYKPDDMPETPVVKELGGKVVIIDLVPGRSTTGIIEKMRDLHNI